MIAAQIFFVIVGLCFFVFVIRNVDKWSISLQEFYVREGGKRDSWTASEIWNTTFFRIILKTGIIFAAIVLILMAYSIIFGPTQL